MYFLLGCHRESFFAKGSSVQLLAIVARSRYLSSASFERRYIYSFPPVAQASSLLVSSVYYFSYEVPRPRTYLGDVC